MVMGDVSSASQSQATEHARPNMFGRMRLNENKEINENYQKCLKTN